MLAHDIIRTGIPASATCFLATSLALVAVSSIVTSTSTNITSNGKNSSNRDGATDEASAGLLPMPEDLLAGSSELCEHARMHCTMRTGCQMGLNNFFVGCSSVINGEDTHCTTACKQALVSLLATADGAGLAFVNCNCSGHQLCEVRKARVQVCQRQVLEAMARVRDDTAAVSCGLARWICEADTSCLTALQYYVQHCAKLFHGTKCTLRCRNSVHILYRQPSAHKLRTCRCEGNEEYDCPRLVTNTERLCFQKHHRHHQQQHPHQQLHDSNYTDEEEEDEETEDGLLAGGGSADVQRTVSGESSSPFPLSGQKETVFKTRKRRNKPKRKKERRGKKKKNQSESTTTDGRKKSQSESTTTDDRKKSQSEPSTTDGRKKSQSESSTPDDRKKSQSESSTTEGRKKSQSESSTTEGRKKNGGGKQGKKPRNKRIRRKLSEEGDSHREEDAEKKNQTLKLTNQQRELTSKAGTGAPMNLERRQGQDG